MRTLRAAGLMILVLAQAAWAQGVIRLKTRSIRPAPATGQARRDTARGTVRHYLVLFGSYPGPDVRAELARRRIRVLAYVPDNALMVSGAGLNLRGLDVTWDGPLDPADKISPVLATQSAGAYLVLLHPDIDVAAARNLVEQRGYAILENPHLLPGELLVTGAFSGLASLADCDAVAYILPASPDLQSAEPVTGCGAPLAEAGPVAEYAQAMAAWSKDSSGGVALRYFYGTLTDKLDATLVRGEIARAFAEWARHAKVTFTATGQSQAARGIDILFARGLHGDPYPFGGPGGTLAHTFYPVPLNPESIAGDVHFDADEAWHVGSSVDLFSIALHEAGHALGLGHSDKPGDVMYPYYRLSTGLAPGDIAAIQAVYGPSGGSGGGGGTGPGGGGTGGSGGSGGKTTPDSAPPYLTILEPAGTITSAYSATISISGSASDNVGVTAVKWSTSAGYSGNASGAASWSAVVPLLVGTNVVTIRAYDAAGNSAWRALTVVRH